MKTNLFLLILLLMSCDRSLPVFPPSEEVESVSVNSELLIREGGNWSINREGIKLPVSSGLTEGFLTSLHQGEISEVITSAHHELFDFSLSETVISGGGRRISFFTGKTAPGSTGQYIRFKDSDEVYILYGDSFKYSSITYWEELSLVDLIHTGLPVYYQEQVFDGFPLRETLLFLSEASAEERAMVQDRIAVLRGLQALKLVTPSEGRLLGRIEFKNTNNEVTTAEIKKDGGEYRMHLLHLPYSHILSYEQVEMLLSQP